MLDNRRGFTYNRPLFFEQCIQLMESEIPLWKQLENGQLSEPARKYLHKAAEEIQAGVSSQRFSALFSMASRYARRTPLSNPKTINGVSLTLWNQLELLRVALLLARQDLAADHFSSDFEALFRFADEGESCALYRAIPLLPDPARFVWRAGEGCRSNMLPIFNAVALDSPFPAKYFDDTAWNQLVMKAVFVETQIDRIQGLDNRLSPELTRMALDFAAERKSAGRTLISGFWLIPGDHQKEALAEMIKGRWADSSAEEQACMVTALGRAHSLDVAQELAGDNPGHQVELAIKLAREGRTTQSDLRSYLANE